MKDRTFPGHRKAFAATALAFLLLPVSSQAARVSNPVAVFSGLDKITGRITTFDVYVGETVQFGALQVTPRACYNRDETEAQRVDAFVEVDEITLDRKIKRIFTGWMFAESPALNAIEHPIFDVWLKDCKAKTGVPAPAGLKVPPSEDPAAPKTPPAVTPAEEAPAQQPETPQAVPVDPNAPPADDFGNAPPADNFGNAPPADDFGNLPLEQPEQQPPVQPSQPGLF